MENSLEKARGLITGGSGFLGRALLSRLTNGRGDGFTVMARDEGKLLSLKRDYPDVEIICGDVADWGDVKRAMIGVDFVYHLAGFKHLPLAEKESEHCIRTNVIGSLNILRASLETKPDIVLGVSTDKAYQPANCYGMSKRLMEYMFAEYSAMNRFTKYRIVRYGNVLGSTGSVIEIWKNQLAKNEPIRITDPEMTRFFFSVDQAVETILSCLNLSVDATPFIPPMKAARMGDLAKMFLGMVGYPNHPVKVVGLRPGEKLHEGMADGVDSGTAERYTDDELSKLIMPLL